MRRFAAALIAISMLAAVRLSTTPGSSPAFAPSAVLHTQPKTEDPAREVAILGELERLAHRIGLGDASSMRAAMSARAAIAAGVAPADVKGADGRWIALGRGPLRANIADYPSNYGAGFGHLAGRVSDFAYDPTHKRLYAAVAQGGLWATDDLGDNWYSVGEAIPTQLMGSVGVSPAKGGTLIALTGDNAFGGDTYPGLGAYWSTDNGASWHKSRGVPDGALGFKVAVDPADPRVVYLATGLGLYRSTDDAVSFSNVDLPTGRCHGDSLAKNCFLANVVTDVVVQGRDKFGHAGGAVLAAVGWRAGNIKNFNGAPQAPANGLYRSATGQPGTFKRLDVDAIGFARRANIGRVEMGIAAGPEQNHGYVYAIVQDAKLFNEPAVLGIQGVRPDPLLGLGASTVLNGIYVSPDFGAHWKKMASGTELQLPGNDSALSGALAADGYGPGAQSWYDQWIRPDPTMQSNGVPTRLVFGLEEIWSNELPLPQNGLSLFHAIGPYEANSGACLLILLGKACSTIQTLHPNNLTTHPDHHAGIFIPDGSGGVTLFDGNDGGVAAQHVGSGGRFTQAAWGVGSNNGFHTLLPYGVAVGADGSVYAGLQDNGELKIEPSGRQVAVFGGDGTMTLADPRDANIVYESLPAAGIYGSADGGHSWTSMDPFLTNAAFTAPMVMDPLNPDHLVSAGREIAESIWGKNTSSNSIDDTGPNKWVYSWNLGTKKHPGNPDVFSTASDPDNQATALAVRGAAIYAAYCGTCDPVRDHLTFKSGLATNVGRSKKPKTLTENGWHFAKANGLPQASVTAIQIDPLDVRTIYVTVGGGLRPYVPPGKLGRDGITPRSGHVFVSHDAGESFTDISGNLRNIPALWVVLHERQLVVATTVGVFVSDTTKGKAFRLLGQHLPTAPVFSLALSPYDPDLLVAASFGRGVYAYHFGKAGTVRPVPLPAPSVKAIHLPATGVAAHDAAGFAVLATSVVLALWMRRRRVGREGTPV